MYMRKGKRCPERYTTGRKGIDDKTNNDKYQEKLEGMAVRIAMSNSVLGMPIPLSRRAELP